MLTHFQNFILKKIKRLIIPYISTSIIVISIKLITDKFMYVENPVTILSYLKILYLPEAGYFLWYIWTLFTLFLVVPLFSSNQISRNILYVLTFIISYLPISGTEIFCLDKTIHMSRYFILGMMAVDYKSYLRPLTKIPTLVPILLFGIIYATDICLSKIVTPYLGIWAMLSASLKISQYSNGQPFRLLTTISVASYIIYLFHTTFEGFTKAVLYKIPLFTSSEHDYIFVIEALIVIFSGIICPLILFNILSRQKTLAFLFGLKYIDKKCAS